jgi:phosphate transport system substrate-binding protein
MVNLGQAWAQEFMKLHPGAALAVTGGGSGTGIAALIQGSTTLAMSSRTIKPEEIEQAKKNNVTPKKFTVGYDGIAVVVHPDNPVSTLTTGQLADIYTGKITDWKDVGGKNGKIVLLSREVNSGTHVYFKEHILNKGDSKGKAEFSASALLIPSSQGIADEVAQNPRAIGYFGMGYITKKQKAVSVAADESSKPEEPTLKNVLSGKYPISRPLFIYSNGEPKGQNKAVIDFILSDKGQELVKTLGFVPIKK